MENILNLIPSPSEIFALNKEKGGWDEDRSVEEMAMLIITEIADVIEAYRDTGNFNKYYREDGKPEGVGPELADIVIRVLDMCGYEGIEFSDAHKSSIPDREAKEINRHKFFDAMLMATSSIPVLKSIRKVKQLEVWAAYFIFGINHLALALRINLAEDINEKFAFNKTRPRRHGGKFA
jgi:NTP pyrophosphatase (non-canonical NTP hydrolase)